MELYSEPLDIIPCFFASVCLVYPGTSGMATGKGQKRVRNSPVFYDEMKKVHELMFTPTAWQKLQNKAKQQGVSVSEMIEIWARSFDAE